jgi:hypothetical protein
VSADGSSVVASHPPQTPTITWANAADIIYDTALSSTQFDATASVTVNATITRSSLRPHGSNLT